MECLQAPNVSVYCNTQPAHACFVSQCDPQVTGVRMRYRKLGETGLETSVLGFGASPLGDVFSVTDPAEGERAVRHAIERGINFFDVSPYYGETLAEERLGAALRGRRGEVILASKCGRYGAREFDFSAGSVTSRLEESLSRLRTDHLDLLQVHDVEFGNVDQILDETLPALRKAQQAGKTRFIGVTGYSLKTLTAIVESSYVDTVLTYCRYNLLTRDMDAMLTPLVEARSIGLINASPLHMGILSPHSAPEWHPAPTLVREAGVRAREIAGLHGANLPEIALRFCLSHPYVASTLVGMSSVEQVDQNLRALNAEDDSAILQEITMAIAPALDIVWPSGLVENYG